MTRGASTVTGGGTEGDLEAAVGTAPAMTTPDPQTAAAILALVARVAVLEAALAELVVGLRVRELHPE